MHKGKHSLRQGDKPRVLDLKTIFLACGACLMTVTVLAAVLDDFSGGTFNESGNWTLNQVIQSSNPSDTITYDQTTNAGKLTVTYVDEQGSDQITLTTWNGETLDVGEFLQVKTAILAGGGVLVRPGIALATTTTPNARANTLLFGLRGDIVARAHAYRDGGIEFSDPDAAITGYNAGDEVTLRIVRSSEREYQLFYGVEGPAETFVGAVTWPETGGTPPSVPAILLDNGLASFTATFDDFEIGTAGAEPTPTPTPTPTPLPTPDAPNITIDDFNDSSLDAAWETENYPQRDGEIDPITITEAGGKLTVEAEDAQGSAQVTLFLRNDVTLEPEDNVQVDVRVVSGETTPLVRAGLGMAPTPSGIDGDRSNTLWFGIRNDGIMRGNAYGNAGAEIGGVEPALDAYAPGTDVFTLAVQRLDENRYALWYGQNAPATVLAGTVNFAGATPPDVPGLFFGVGLADLTLEFDNFRMFKKNLPNQAKTWSIYP